MINSVNFLSASVCNSLLLITIFNKLLGAEACIVSSLYLHVAILRDKLETIRLQTSVCRD